MHHVSCTVPHVCNMCRYVMTSSPRHDLAGYRVGNPTPMGRFWVYRVAQPGRPGCTGLCVWTPRPRCVRALGAPPPLPPPGMCTCGEIVDENPARLAAPLSTTTCRERKADSEKRVQPLAGTTRVLLGVEKSRLAKTTGTQKPGCSKLPGSRNPATQIFRVEPGISTRRPGLRLGLPNRPLQSLTGPGSGAGLPQR